MIKIIETSIGVCLGILLSLLGIWIVMCVVSFISGDRYFTPSAHLMKKRFSKKFSDISQ